jgi:phage terminase small subunit
MPGEKRLSAKKLKYADMILQGHSGAEAARLAGYAERHARGTAYRLSKDPALSALIAERRNEIAERNAITVDSMLEQLSDDRQFAKETGNATAAVRATELTAKLAGLLIERRDVRGLHGIKVELVNYGQIDDYPPAE